MNNQRSSPAESLPKLLAAAIVPLLLAFAPAAGQTEFSGQAPVIEGPQFFAEFLNYESARPGMTRLDVYVDVGYDVLQFVNDNGSYRASYEITATLSDTVDKTVDEKTWTETVTTPKYEQSVSTHASNLSEKSFDVAPGKYHIQVQLTDNETKKTSRLKRPLIVRQFGASRFLLSDLMLVNSINKEGDRLVVSPNISGSLGNRRDTAYLYFEAYNRLGVDSTPLVLTVLDERRQTVKAETLSYTLTGEKTDCFLRFSVEGLQAGMFVMQVSAFPRKTNPDGSTVDAAAFTSRQFVLRWKGLPQTVVDIDAAIDQMMYMVDKDELDRLRAGDKDQRKEKFLAFWKSRDPSPNTERNELMEEYYARVDYANKHFGHYIDGWKSDMGMVYIIFGPPSNIERHPFDIDSKPYEIWTYYDQNREFVFIDQSGFGDFKLQTPIWETWRNRPR